MMFLYISDKIKKMKKLLFLLFAIILISCSQKVSEKDLEGVWWFFDGTGDGELSFKNDSITIDNGYGLPYTGSYELKKDSIIIYFEGNVKVDYLKYNSKDSLLIYKNAKYYKRFSSLDSSERVHTKFDLINIKSKTTIHSDSLNINSSIFLAFKNKSDELKLILNGKVTTTEDLPAFLIVRNCFGGNSTNYYEPYLILGKAITVLDLSKIYVYLSVINLRKIKVFSHYDFPNRLFHYYNIRVDLFKEKLLKNGPPPAPHDISRKDYLAKFNPDIITMKSKQDFKKLNSIKPNSHYLVSINLDLSIEDYLHLTQELQSFRENGKTKIRTELINL